MAPEDDDLSGRVLDLFGRAAKRGLSRAAAAGRQAADVGRHQLELRQARRDLESFWIRLGKIAFRLGQGGELDHPAIDKAVRRIEALEARIEELEAGIRED